MNKYNRKFNSRIKRLNKWVEIKARLSLFESLFLNLDGLTADDVHDLKIIHKKLTEAYAIAKEHEHEVRYEIQRHCNSMELSH